MKKIIRLTLMTAMACCAIISCSKDNIQDKDTPTEEKEKGYVTLSYTANMESTTTKMAGSMDNTDGKYKFSWSEGDKIQVIYNGGTTTANATVANGVAQFNVSVPEGTSDIWMVYPSDNGASLSEGELELSMPAIQKDALNGLFVAKVSATDKIANFYHPICYYKAAVNGDGSDITRMDIELTGSVLTAKKARLSFNSVTKKPSVTATTDGSSKIEATFNGTGTYYIPVIPSEDEIAPGNLSFQCYRESEDGVKLEKAGAYTYTKKTLTNSRASIINWSSLPAMISNRYVTVDGNGLKTGSAANKWDCAKFQAFLKTQASDSLDGVRVHVAEGTYPFAKVGINFKKSIKIYIEGEGTDKTFFDGGKSNVLFGQNLADTPDDQTVSFKGITFQNGKRTNDNAGAFFIKFGKFIFEDCLFCDNEVTAEGKGGGVCNAYNNATVVFKRCNFFRNSAELGGVLIMEGGSDVTFIDCNLGDGTDANKNIATHGGAVYSKYASSKVTFKGGSISGNAARGEGSHGGAIWAKGTLVVEGTTISKNTTSGATVKNNNNGAAIYLNDGLLEASFKNVVFEQNSIDPTITTDQFGGAVRIEAQTDITEVSFDGCIFRDNFAQQASCICFHGNTILKINNCLFSGNRQYSRGAFQGWSNGVVFFNRCAFYNNTTSNASNSWGYEIHGKCCICANNCTFYGGHNTASSSGNIAAINGYHSLLMTNSTMIESAPLALLRIDDANGKQVLCNNILINTQAQEKIFTGNTSAGFTDNGHNAINQSSGWKTFNASDKTDCTASTFTGSFSEEYNVYSWSNSLDGFSKATVDDIKSTMQNDFDVSSCGLSSLGDAFYNWLDGMTPKGYATDGRNTVRQNWWPGSYDK